MNKRIWLAASLLAFSGSANAALVFSDNFEDDGAATGLTTLKNFKVTDGVTVDIVSPATGPGYSMSRSPRREASRVAHFPTDALRPLRDVVVTCLRHLSRNHVTRT